MSTHKKIRKLTTLALLTAFITITGAFKIPGIFPGTEFQLSAPIAVAICGIFGVWNYLVAGVLSSLLGLILGSQNLLNVFIAMIFRIVVALVFLGLGKSKLFYIFSGPLGTLVARLSLSLFLGKAALPLIIAAAAGMIYTSIFSLFLGNILEKISSSIFPQSEKV